MNLVEKYRNIGLRRDVPKFRPGDSVKVFCKIREGEKERIQVFEGVCIARHNAGIASSFTVRKVSYGVGVERVFPVHSPAIDHVEVLTEGKVRRSKLYYLRELSGKAARIEGRFLGEEEIAQAAAELAANQDGAVAQ